jgi:hypothetical protein
MTKRSGIFTAVTIKNAIFSDMIMSCGSSGVFTEVTMKNAVFWAMMMPDGS